MNKARVSSSGSRKYSAIWQKLKNEGKCIVGCTHADSHTIIHGVKKEKNRDINKPKGKMLNITSEEIPSGKPGVASTVKITFKLINEVSINTI